MVVLNADIEKYLIYKQELKGDLSYKLLKKTKSEVQSMDSGVLLAVLILMVVIVAVVVVAAVVSVVSGVIAAEEEEEE